MINKYRQILALQEQILEKTNKLVNDDLLDGAKGALEKYSELLFEERKVIKQLEGILEVIDVHNKYVLLQNKYMEMYSIKGIIALKVDRIDEAKAYFIEGLNISEECFDLQYNLAYVYNIQSDVEMAIQHYKKAYDLCIDLEIKEGIRLMLEEWGVPISKSKIAFFVKQGYDSFINSIIQEVQHKYEVKKIIVTEYQQIDDGMDWADICWFEWCDELVAYGSKLQVAKNKINICRLHSYEVFVGYPMNVEWINIDKVIVIGKQIRDILIEQVPQIQDKIEIIPNGVDMTRYHFRERKEGFNIAYVGYINYKKGPMLLLHAFKAIYDFDTRYKLYIAGEFQDQRDVLYFKKMIKEMGLQDNVFYEGWQDNLDVWLEDKAYIICTSILESQNMSVMQAMAKGIKPLIHNFVGAEDMYPKKLLWNTISECVQMLETPYATNEYKEFIEHSYELELQMERIHGVLEKEIVNNHRENILEPLVSICITNYNYEKYLEEAIQSVINQVYTNIELIIIDDCSDDNSREIIKQYESEYKWIRAEYNTINRGYCYGIKKFIEKLCKGKYFVILSADDALADEFTIKKLVDEHKKYGHRCDYIYGDQILIDAESNIMSKYEFGYISPKEVVKKTFNQLGAGVLPILFAMHKTDFYRKNNYTWEEINGVANDTLNTLVSIKRNTRYAYLNYPVCRYRQHNNNMTFNLKTRLKDIYGIIEYMIDNFDVDKQMSSGNIIFTEEQAYEEKTVYLIQYYFNVIVYYLEDFKVFGQWEVQEPLIERVKHLEVFKDKCFEYIKEYVEKEYTLDRDIVESIEEQLKLLYKEAL